MGRIITDESTGIWYREPDGAVEPYAGGDHYDPVAVFRYIDRGVAVLREYSVTGSTIALHRVLIGDVELMHGDTEWPLTVLISADASEYGVGRYGDGSGTEMLDPDTELPGTGERVPFDNAAIGDDEPIVLRHGDGEQAHVVLMCRGDIKTTAPSDVLVRSAYAKPRYTGGPYYDIDWTMYRMAR